MVTTEKILNLAFYKFVTIEEPAALKDAFFDKCRALGLKGTILIAAEGINGMVAGQDAAARAFKAFVKSDARFCTLSFKESYSDRVPFKRLLIKVKKEILTLRDASIDPRRERMPYIRAEELRESFDRGDKFHMVDVRNDFEVAYGTFRGAINPKTKSFGQFKAFAREGLKTIPKNEKIVTFCTGGIRCEKGVLLLKQAGFENVFQLEGGILEYFAKTDGKYFEGRCFVFDEREAVGPESI